MTIDALLTRLEGVSAVAGGWTSKCPSHADRSPSLSISDGGDKILLWCFAGCPAENIVDALGIEMRDLFYDSSAFNTTALLQPQAIYDYVDENGLPLYQVLRFPGKKFRQRHLGPEGWEWNMSGVRKVLYRLPDVADLQWKLSRERKPTVYIVEGEKDAEALRAAGKVATTCVGGGKKWLPGYVKYFRDLDVVIVRDKDETGHEHAELIRDSLDGIARSVWVVEAKTGKDVSDHLQAGCAVEELVVVQ